MPLLYAPVDVTARSPSNPAQTPEVEHNYVPAEFLSCKDTDGTGTAPERPLSSHHHALAMPTDTSCLELEAPWDRIVCLGLPR